MISTEEVKEVKRLHKRGMSTTQIAKVQHHGQQNVARIIRGEITGREPLQKNPGRWPGESMRQAVIRLHKEKATLKESAKILGVTDTTISYHRQAHKNAQKKAKVVYPTEPTRCGSCGAKVFMPCKRCEMVGKN